MWCLLWRALVLVGSFYVIFRLILTILIVVSGMEKIRILAVAASADWQYFLNDYGRIHQEITLLIKKHPRLLAFFNVTQESADRFAGIVETKKNLRPGHFV